MSDLTPESPEVRLVAAWLGCSAKTVHQSFRYQPGRLKEVAAEHTRLVAQAVEAALSQRHEDIRRAVLEEREIQKDIQKNKVKAARIEALREAVEEVREHFIDSYNEEDDAQNDGTSCALDAIQRLIDKEEAK